MPIGGRFGSVEDEAQWRGRRDVGAARLRHGEAQRMADRAGGGLLVARQPREDRQAGRIGAGPAGLGGRPHVVAVEVEDGAAVRVPADRPRCEKAR